MSDTIFEQDGVTPPAGSTPPAPVAKLPDEVAELVGPGKKYASMEEALKSVPHAQQHISKLEEELKALREKTEKAIAAEEVYKTVKEMLAKDGKPPAAGLAEADIDSVLDRKLAARAEAMKAKENTEQVKQALVAQFGDKAVEVYRQKAAALGIGVEFLNDLAAKSPAAALELLGVKATPPAPGTTRPGSVNTDALNINKKPEQPKSVMGGAPTSAVIAAWRAAAPKT